MTADEIFAMIKKNPLIKGVTFSGGEPMCQSEALMPLAKMIKEAGLELAIYTGYTFEEIAENPLARVCGCCRRRQVYGGSEKL